MWTQTHIYWWRQHFVNWSSKGVPFTNGKCRYISVSHMINYIYRKMMLCIVRIFCATGTKWCIFGPGIIYLKAMLCRHLKNLPGIYWLHDMGTLPAVLVFCEVWRILPTKGQYISQMAKTLGSTSIRRRSDTFASDRYIIDVDPKVFPICVVPGFVVLFVVSMN